jgi:glycosyltransferase involved in cell wall biosynthesis
MKKDKLISVIIPIYNSAARIEKCLDTVLTQRYGNLEILCVDDGSTDDTPEILKRYEARDRRVKVITQRNAGAGAARNAGLRACRGDYLSFLDSDDFFERNMYSKMMGAATKHDAEICVCDADTYNDQVDYYFPSRPAVRAKYLPDKEVFSADDIPDYIFNVFNGYPWNKLFKADFVKAAGIAFQEIENSNDMFFVYMALALADRITVVRDILAHKTANNEGSLSESADKNYRCSYLALSKLKGELAARGLYDKLKRSFVNRAVNNTVFNISVVGGDSKKAYFCALKEKWLEELEMVGHPEDYYHDKERRDAIRVIATNTYEEYLLQQVYKFKKLYQNYPLRLAALMRPFQKMSRVTPLTAKLYQKGISKFGATNNTPRVT